MLLRHSMMNEAPIHKFISMMKEARTHKCSDIV